MSVSNCMWVGLVEETQPHLTSMTRDQSLNCTPTFSIPRYCRNSSFKNLFATMLLTVTWGCRVLLYQWSANLNTRISVGIVHFANMLKCFYVLTFKLCSILCSDSAFNILGTYSSNILGWAISVILLNYWLMRLLDVLMADILRCHITACPLFC